MDTNDQNTMKNHPAKESETEELMRVEQSLGMKGTLRVMGAKNSALPILAATLLGTEDIFLEDVPPLEDVKVMLEVLKTLGAEVEYLDDGRLRINSAHLTSYEPPEELVSKMRASFLVVGPLLARFGIAITPSPGGCSIGKRPTDLHHKGFRALGAETVDDSANLSMSISAPDGLQGDTVYLDFPSVGATQNIIMAATMARGETLIENAAKEPEIVDLCSFLGKMGADIKGAGTSNIRIRGVEKLGGVTNHSVIPDRIETATFMVLAAMTQSDLVIDNVIPDHVQPITAKLKEVGCTVEVGEEQIRVIGPKRLKPTNIKTLPYPGFPTDAQSPFMAMLTLATGKQSVVVETVFENRFQHVQDLRRMGAQIEIDGNTATITGVRNLHGDRVFASDLRAAAALILAGLVAEGTTIVSNLHHADRGYVQLEERLRAIGAKIERITVQKVG